MKTLAISVLIQPKDRDYKTKGKARQEHLEIREDEVCYNLRTGGQTLILESQEVSCSEFG